MHSAGYDEEPLPVEDVTDSTAADVSAQVDASEHSESAAEDSSGPEEPGTAGNDPLPRRSARDRRPVQRYGYTNMQVTKPPRVSEWTEKMEYLWRKFPERRQDIYHTLMKDLRGSVET